MLQQACNKQAPADTSRKSEQNHENAAVVCGLNCEVYPLALTYSALCPLPVLYRNDDLDAIHIASEPKTLPSKRSTLWHVGYLDVFAPDCSFRNYDSLGESVELLALLHPLLLPGY